VEGSILCLEGSSNETLTFVSSPVAPWRTGKLAGRQILVSDEAHEILSRKFKKVAFLSCKYNHPITLGALTLELLPSGEAPGSSFLLIRKNERSLLYVSHWNPDTHPAIRAAKARPTNRLVVHLESGKKSTGGGAAAIRSEIERLATLLRTVHEKQTGLGIFLEPTRDLHRVLAALPPSPIKIFGDDKVLEFANACAVSFAESHRPFREIFKNMRPLSEFEGGPGIVIVSKHSKPQTLPDIPWALITSHKEGDAPAQVTISERFCIAHIPGPSDILKLASETGASEVVLVNTGAAAEACVAYLMQHGVSASLLSAPQTTPLF
jgi:hypothetical protein